MTHIGERQRQPAAPGWIRGGGGVTGESDAEACGMINPVVRTIKLRERTGDLSTV
jgi:hypothetical protein